MDAATVELVRTIGFPAASAIALAAWSLYQDKAQRGERTAFLAALDGQRASTAALVAGIERLTADVRDVRDLLNRRAA